LEGLQAVNKAGFSMGRNEVGRPDRSQRRRQVRSAQPDLGDHPQAYANRIILFGRPRGSGESIWEIKRRIGWVSPELHRYHPPHTTPFDIVCSGYFDSIGLHRRCTDEQRTRAHRWLKRMGLEDAPIARSDTCQRANSAWR